MMHQNIANNNYIGIANGKADGGFPTKSKWHQSVKLKFGGDFRGNISVIGLSSGHNKVV